MTNQIKIAFAGITAEDCLKERTLEYLYGEIQKRTVKKSGFAVNRLAVCAAVCAVLLCIGAYSHNLYFTASAYLDMDVNPSIELAINRFNRVIDAYSYNAEGEDILSGLKLKHKRYDAALTVLVDAFNQEGYMSENSLVSVTLQTDDESIEKQLLPELQAGVTAAAHHHGTAQVDVFTVDHETRDLSHQYNISPAKYLALLELMEVDPTATIEGCKSHSINEIKQQTHSHSETHHGNHSDNNGEQDGADPVKDDDTDKNDGNEQVNDSQTDYGHDKDDGSQKDDNHDEDDDAKDDNKHETVGDSQTDDDSPKPSDNSQGHGQNKNGQHHGRKHN